MIIRNRTTKISGSLTRLPDFLLPTEKYSRKYLAVIIKMITFVAHL
jgi:hypothetical protein